MLTSNMLTANSVVCLSDKRRSMNMFQGTDLAITFIQDFQTWEEGAGEL